MYIYQNTKYFRTFFVKFSLLEKSTVFILIFEFIYFTSIFCFTCHQGAIWTHEGLEFLSLIPHYVGSFHYCLVGNQQD